MPKSVTECGASWGGAFDKVASLKRVTFQEGMKKIPDFICYATDYSSHISSVSIPDTVTEIGASAFQNCTLLKALEFSDNVKKLIPTHMQDAQVLLL